MEVQRKDNIIKINRLAGYFEVVGGYRFWKPSPSGHMTDEEQFNHNCDIDPDFRIMQPIGHVVAASRFKK